MFTAVTCIHTYAQSAGGPAAVQQTSTKETKPSNEMVKQQMVEKTGLTAAQVEKVMAVNWEIREAAGNLRDLSDADRSAKIAELKALKGKKYSEIPLSREQIGAVYAFYEDMGKNAQQKTAN